MSSEKKECLTPNANWKFEFHPGKVTLVVTYQDMQGGLVGVLDLSRTEAMQMESEIHDALEPIFAARWTAQYYEYRALKDAEIAAMLKTPNVKVRGGTPQAERPS